jgi:hypothetical protein
MLDALVAQAIHHEAPAAPGEHTDALQEQPSSPDSTAGIL